jgi:phosphatidylserine/phosphatidylglycerophosphate/cardiolipin synthase-like enzyme
MELNLVKNLVKKLERTDDLRVRMIMDYHRGQRENIKSPIREMSSYEFFHNIAMANVNADIQVGMLNCSSTDMGSL